MEAVAVQAPIHRVYPKIKGASIHKKWYAKVTNAALVPRAYLIPDIDGLNGIAQSSKGQFKIPGVEFYSDDILTSRG
jgi:hypothetical protein